MFERFTDDAKATIVHAQEEARRLRHNYIGTEHILLGLLRDPGGVGSRALDRWGLRWSDVRGEVLGIVGEGPPARFEDAEAEVLRAIGIDLHEIRRRMEEAFGPGALDRPVGQIRGRRRRRRCGQTVGALRFTPRAKKVLELAKREAKHLKQDQIGAGHVLLGILREGEGLAADILARRAGRREEIREAVLYLLSRN
jgi:ATP-dependent Clp protease ATP-binding subunit ClpA